VGDLAGCPIFGASFASKVGLRASREPLSQPNLFYKVQAVIRKHKLRWVEDFSMTFSPKAIFQRAEKYDGVRPINIYLLRLLYILMFFVLGKETWTHILTHQGPWEPMDAVAWCVWTAFATLAGLGIIRPLKMLPIVLPEIFYKLLWLTIVAYPLWSKGTLAGSPAEGITSEFLWVILPIVAVPWGYAFVNYIYKPKK
jgi:hypothetical protein